MYSRSGFIKGDKKNESDDVIGSIKVELTDWKKRPSADNILNDLENMTQSFLGINIEFIEKKDGPPKDRDIEIEILNNNSINLKKDTQEIFQYISNRKWVKNIDSDISLPGIDWELIIDRSQADKHGIEIETIGNAIQMLTHGLKVSEYMPSDSDDEIDIVVKYDREYRTLDELDNIQLEGNGPIALSLIVQRVPKNKTGKITRVNSMRSKCEFDVIKVKLQIQKRK